VNTRSCLVKSLRRLGRALAWLGVALVVPVNAQPYAAGGGFDRPQSVGESTSSLRFAVAAARQRVFAFWSDEGGIWSRALHEPGPAERIVEGRGIRELAAAGLDGGVAVAWARRSLDTGRTRHWLRWRGEERLLLDSLQPYDLTVVDAPSGPAVLIARGEEGQSVLRLGGWDGRETVVRRSDLSLVSYHAVYDDNGRAIVIWLEGYRDRTAIGVSAEEWTAFLTTVQPDGEVGPLIELGPASYRGTSSRTVVAIANGEVHALWSGPGDRVLFSRPGEAPLTVGRGWPVGLSDRLAYWAEGSSIRSRDPLRDSEPVNVAWSPITVQWGELVEAGEVSYLTWYGPKRGGEFEVFFSRDLQPIQLTLMDRMAAAMGWSPWSFWEALFGQLMGALFAGVLMTMALSPILWLAAVGAIRAGWGRRPMVSGIVTGLLVLLAVLAVLSLRNSLPAEVQVALFGSLTQWAVALLLGAGITWLVRRRDDSEQLIGMLGSAWLLVFVGTSTLAFLTFQAWMHYWSTLV
jgi:hypothetical protein